MNNNNKPNVNKPNVIPHVGFVMEIERPFTEPTRGDINNNPRKFGEYYNTKCNPNSQTNFNN